MEKVERQNNDDSGTLGRHAFWFWLRLGFGVAGWQFEFQPGGL